MALLRGLNPQNYVSDKYPMPVDNIADTSKAIDVTGETVQLYYFVNGVPTVDAGEAAGTVVVAKLLYTGILDRMGAMIGNQLETSLSWTTNTVLPLEQIKICAKTTIEKADVETIYEMATLITANYSNGDWCLDHRTGLIFGKKKTTGTSDTAAYKIQASETSGSGGLASDVNLAKLGNVNISAKDAAFAEPPVGMGLEFEALGSLTTDGSAAGDKVPAKGTATGVQYVQITNETVPLDILTQDAAFGTGARGLAVFGKYQSTPTTYTDGDACPVLLDANGRIVLSSDIEIGAVEMKDSDTDNRANIKAANTARTTGTLVLASQLVGADGTVPPTGSLNTNAPFAKITDGTSNLTLGTGTVKTLPCAVNDGTTTAVVETDGTKKALNVNVTDGTNDMPTMDAAARAGYVQITDGTSSEVTRATLASTTAVAASLVVKAGAGALLGFSGYNGSASAQYIQVHNTASLPADTAVPVIVIKAEAGENFSFASTKPITFATGIVVCNSSTLATKTIGSADCWIQAEYV